MKKTFPFEKLMGGHQVIDDPVLKNFYESNKTTYQSIKELIHQNNILPFIGAGFSAEIYPTWNRFLLDTASAYPACEEGVSSFIHKGDYEEAAEKLCAEMTMFSFRNKIGQTFGKKTLSGQFDKISTDRKRLKEIFRCNIITTNYDRIIETIYHNDIERVCPHMGYQQSFLEKILQSNQRSLIKLHGDIEDIHNIVITKGDYEKVYGRVAMEEKPTTLVLALKQILCNHSILFLGCSLYSDRTMQVLSDSAGQVRQYYALMELPKETENPQDPFSPFLIDRNGHEDSAYRRRRKFLADHHINCIWYPYGMHVALDVLLEELYKDNCTKPSHICAEKRSICTKRKILGRDDEIEELCNILRTQNKIVFITGTGGIGKTELCYSLIDTWIGQHPGFIMSCIDLFGVDSLELFCSKVAASIGYQDLQQADDIDDGLEKLNDAICSRARLGYGLYIDNWEEMWIGLAKCEEKRVRLLCWLEKLVFCGIKILISSWERPHQYDFAIYIYHVRPLDSSKGIDKQLFDSVYHQKGGKLPLKGIEYESILENLGGHPLSIVLVATFASAKVSWSAVLKAWINAEMKGKNKRHNNLRTALSISWESISGKDVCVQIWGMLALCIDDPDPQFIGSVLQYSEDECLEALTTLYDISMIDWSDEGKIMMLSPVKKVFFQLASQEQIEHSFKCYCSFIEDLIAKTSRDADGRYHNHSLLIDMLPQIYYVLTVAMDLDVLSDQIMRLCYGLQNHFQFHCAQSFVFLEKCLIYAKKKKNDPFVTFVLLNSGKMKSRLGDVKGALKLYQEVERLYRGEQEDLGLANVLQSIGDLKSRLGDVDGALEQYREAEKLYRCERDGLGLANVLQSMGNLKGHLGDTDGALGLYHEAEGLYRKEQDGLGLANVLKSIGDLKRYLGNMDGVQGLYLEAEELYRRERSGLGLANALKSMGDLKQRLGDLDQALGFYEEAESLYRSERDALGLANVLQCMGDILFLQDKLQEAIKIYESALVLYKSENEIVGGAYTMSELSLAYSLCGERDKAFKMILELDKVSYKLPYENVKQYIDDRVNGAEDILKKAL